VQPSEKPKRSPRRRLGCVIALLLISALCYGSMWVFARIGGEWATAGDIPVPDSSQFVTATYNDSFEYLQKQNLYVHRATPEELRGWFVVQAHIGMTPIALDLEGNSFIDNDDFYMQPPLFHRMTLLNELQRMAATYTAGWFDEMVSQCQGVHIFKNYAAATRAFPDQNLPDDMTAFVISTCWPNVS